MADQATERATIDAPPQKCFDVALDFERYPEWARDIKEASVVEYDDEGRGKRVAFRVAAMGRSAHYTLEYDYANAPRELSWKLVDGDIMRTLDGTYIFYPGDDGASSCMADATGWIPAHCSTSATAVAEEEPPWPSSSTAFTT